MPTTFRGFGQSDQAVQSSLNFTWPGGVPWYCGLEQIFGPVAEPVTGLSPGNDPCFAANVKLTSVPPVSPKTVAQMSVPGAITPDMIAAQTQQAQQAANQAAFTGAATNLDLLNAGVTPGSGSGAPACNAFWQLFGCPDFSQFTELALVAGGVILLLFLMKK
jgi:hypothetical protein